MIIKSNTYFGDDLYLTMSGTLVVASNSDQISIFQVINWQIPQTIRHEGPKKKSVAHCVHMLRNLDIKRLKDINIWLKIQKSIGMAKIRMYVTTLQDASNLSKEVLKLNYTDFVEVVYYKLSFSGMLYSFF